MNLVPSPNAHRLVTVFLWLATLGTTACGSDGEGLPKDESSASSTKRDAGPSRARDAGRVKDAKVADPQEADDEDEGESTDTETDADDEDKEDSAKVDPKPMAKDGGTTSAKEDAGKQTGSDAGSTTPGATESCDELTYATFGEMFLKTYCYECHSSKLGMPLGGVTLDTRAGITKTMSTLKKMVIPQANGRQPAMPKGGNDKLTDAERLKFGKWIDCGAK